METTNIDRCERCQEALNPDRVVWLEFNQNTNTYHDPDKDPVPEEESLGLFPFGRACARSTLGSGGELRQ